MAWLRGVSRRNLSETKFCCSPRATKTQKEKKESVCIHVLIWWETNFRKGPIVSFSEDFPYVKSWDIRALMCGCKVIPFKLQSELTSIDFCLFKAKPLKATSEQIHIELRPTFWFMRLRNRRFEYNNNIAQDLSESKSPFPQTDICPWAKPKDLSST